jgi:uncharacterized protein YecT (DUF1311 family)
VEPIPAPVHNDAEIEGFVALLGSKPGSGLVASPDRFMQARVFKQMQTDWINLRDDKCEIPASGSCRAEDLADRKSCMLNETKNRTNELLKRQ